MRSPFRLDPDARRLAAYLGAFLIFVAVVLALVVAAQPVPSAP